jgi:hypothetical protein
MQTIFGEKQLQQHPMKKTKTSYLTVGKQPSTITPKASVLKRSYLGASPGSFTQRQQESECARESEMSRTRGTEVKPVVNTTLNA